MTTTTTVIRTSSSARSGSRRANKASARARPKAKTTRARPRTRSTAKRTRTSTSQSTVTAEQKAQYKADANVPNYWPYLIGLGVLGVGGYFLLQSRNANASTGPGGAPGGGGGGGVPGQPGIPGGVLPPPGVVPVPVTPAPGGSNVSPGGHVHPPPGTVATVQVTTGLTPGETPGINLRTAPSPTATLIAGLPNGTSITVVQSNILEQGLANAANANNRWWQVTTSSGQTGYLRAIGPDGVWNVQFAGQVGTGQFRGYRPIARPFGAIPHDPFQALVSRGPLRRG